MSKSLHKNPKENSSKQNPAAHNKIMETNHCSHYIKRERTKHNTQKAEIVRLGTNSKTQLYSLPTRDTLWIQRHKS